MLRHFLDETDATDLDSVGYVSGAELRVGAALAGMIDESGRSQQATPFGFLVSAVHHLGVGQRDQIFGVYSHPLDQRVFFERLRRSEMEPVWNAGGEAAVPQLDPGFEAREVSAHGIQGVWNEGAMADLDGHRAA